MSLGPVNNSQFAQQTQQTKAVAPTATARTEDAQRSPDATHCPGTNTPAEAERTQPNPEAQDAARQRNQGVENQIKSQLDQGNPNGGEWLEARRRTRSTRGGRQMAQGPSPTRGLGVPPDVA